MPLDTEKLRRLIASSGRSMRTVATQAGMHHANVSRILAGKQDATVATLDRLAASLGVTAGELLNPSRPPRTKSP